MLLLAACGEPGIEGLAAGDAGSNPSCTASCSDSGADTGPGAVEDAGSDSDRAEPDAGPGDAGTDCPLGPGASIHVDPTGSDSNDGLSADSPLATIQAGLALARPGDNVVLAPGEYLEDVDSVRDGAADAPITVVGPADAVVRGSWEDDDDDDRVVEIGHDHHVLCGFTIDGLSGDPALEASYHDKLLYVMGAALEDKPDPVVGLRVLFVTLRNAGGECVRLKYFTREAEIAHSTVGPCGIFDFTDGFSGDGKNGEGVYIGTAPEQLERNPTDTPDESNDNWIHDNAFDTRGNECVDIKEGASGNLVESNTCTGQRDPESGGMDSRGSGNAFFDNEIFGCAGAGVRLGGDGPEDGTNNEVRANDLHDNQNGGIKLEAWPQADICENAIEDNDGGAIVGSFAEDAADLDPTAPCP